MSRLKVDVEVNSSKVAPGLMSSTQAIKKWATDLKGTIAGAFGSAAVTAAISRTIDSVNQIGDTASRIGRTTEEVQALAIMASNAGRELSNVEQMLNSIGAAQIDALQGNEERMAQFNRMGISQKTLENTSEFGIAQLMAKATSGMSVSQMRGAGVGDITGTRGLGTFAALQGELENFTARLKEMQDDLIPAETIANFKASADQFSVAWTALTNKIKTVFLPVFTWIVDKLTNILMGLELAWKLFNPIKWISQFVGAWAGGSSMKEALAQVGKEMVDVTNKAIEEYNRKEENTRKAAAGALAAQELAGMGPGAVPPKKPAGKDKDKPIWYKMDVPERLPWNNPGLSPIGTGGFLGTNTSLLGTISRESVALLKKIELNTRQINSANAFNSFLEAMGRVFGVTVR